jgi:outer membrane protein OmpA-like peptidoglycan-associated protein
MVAPGGWYLGGEGGWTMLPDESFSGSASGTYKYNDGFNIGLRGGYMMGPWRFEGEFSYRRNSLSTTTQTAPVSGTITTGGQRQAYAEMFNVLYDFDLGWALTPHLGGGIGVAEQSQDGALLGAAKGVHNTDTEFAYQGIAGVRWMASPAVAVDLDYRYFATMDPTFSGDAAGSSIKSSYGTHNVLASVTMLFGAPPPPPPAPVAAPAPPPAAAKVFIVFFDWDKDTITPEGMAIVQQAADAYKAGAAVQIQVTGYTDRSGSPGYNQRLSERRANNVAKALAGLGVPPNQMAVSGRGENDNRVPTAPGVREPQNRRVEIVFP